MESVTIRITEVELGKFVAEKLVNGLWLRLTVPCSITAAVKQAELEITASFGFVD